MSGRRFVIYCDGGFGNRYNCLVSGLAVSGLLGLAPEVVWPANSWCGADFKDLFAVDLPVAASDLVQLKGTLGGLTVVTHEEQADFLGVPFISPYGFVSAAAFGEFAAGCAEGIFYYTALIPDWIPKERIEAAVRNLRLHPALEQAADDFVATTFAGGFYGIHLRRTDLVSGFSDDEVRRIAAGHPEREFFVCSDSADTERTLSAVTNIRVREKAAMVEKKAGSEGWMHPTIDDSGRAYFSNVTRSAQSVLDAVIDLLVLARSKMLGNSVSTFLAVARLRQRVMPAPASMALPEIDVQPLNEFLRDARLGRLDVLKLMEVGQTLAAERRFDDLLRLYREWLLQAPPASAYVGHFNLGTVLHALGRHAEAESAFRQAVALKPDLFQGHLNLGLQLELQKRLADARQAWAAALGMEAVTRPEHREMRLQLTAHFARLLEAEAAQRQGG